MKNLHQHIIRLVASIALTLLIQVAALALVKYDEDRLEIQGVQLLQDSENDKLYYYLPQFPRVSTNVEGDLEFLFMKYVDAEGDNGGLFHALIEFSLPEEQVAELEAALQQEVPGAKLAGQVPMLQTLNEKNEYVPSSFSVISSVLNNTTGDYPFTETFKTSGHAPLLKGSKAAIAAKLNQKGATLLWESFQGTTSDVSVMVSGYYEAQVKAYGAVVSAEVNTLYEHFSQIKNDQERFTKEEIRKIADKLMQDQTISIDVFDRSKTLGIETEQMEGILDIITAKLTELIFNAESGWSKVPDVETALEEDQIPRSQKRGWLGRVFGKRKDTPYISDHQFVLKERTELRSHKFYLNLNKSTVIKVPFYSTGNIGGRFYEENQTDNKYFRIVNMDDPDFQIKKLDFVLDGAYAGSYNSVLNFIMVSFRKKYSNGQHDVVKDLIFDRNQLLNDETLTQNILYPRLGLDAEEFNQYEYRVKYAMTGNRGNFYVPTKDEWQQSTEASITLTPPYLKTDVVIDLERERMKVLGIRSARILFTVTLNGREEQQITKILRVDDTENINHVSLYHDKDTTVKYQINWYTDSKTIEDDELALKGTYIFLHPPK